MAGVKGQEECGVPDLLDEIHQRLDELHLDVLHTDPHSILGCDIGSPAVGIEKLLLDASVIGLDLVVEDQDPHAQLPAHLERGEEDAAVQGGIIRTAQIEATPDVGGVAKRVLLEHPLEHIDPWLADAPFDDQGEGIQADLDRVEPLAGQRGQPCIQRSKTRISRKIDPDDRPLHGHLPFPAASGIYLVANRSLTWATISSLVRR